MTLVHLIDCHIGTYWILIFIKRQPIAPMGGMQVSTVASYLQRSIFLFITLLWLCVVQINIASTDLSVAPVGVIRIILVELLTKYNTVRISPGLKMQERF
jgi:hypothetical protein